MIIVVYDIRFRERTYNCSMTFVISERRLKISMIWQWMFERIWISFNLLYIIVVYIMLYIWWESFSQLHQRKPCPVGWGYRIHWLHLCWGSKTSLNECARYDTKQCDGEIPVIMELWGMWSIPLLSSLPGPLCPGVVASDRVLSMDEIK